MGRRDELELLWSSRSLRPPSLGSVVVKGLPIQLPPDLPLLLLSQAKFFCAVQGELNCCNSMGAQEMHQRLQHLKRSIHRVHLYSQGEARPPPGQIAPGNPTQDPMS